PMGTGGAIKFAQELLDERFFVLNGDVLTDIDLTEQLAQHEQTGARGTLVLFDESKAVTEFVEKPAYDEIESTPLISAGAYVLEREVLDLMPPDQNVS